MTAVECSGFALHQARGLGARTGGVQSNSVWDSTLRAARLRSVPDKIEQILQERMAVDPRNILLHECEKVEREAVDDRDTQLRGCVMRVRLLACCIPQGFSARLCPASPSGPRTGMYTRQVANRQNMQ